MFAGRLLVQVASSAACRVTRLEAKGWLPGELFFLALVLQVRGNSIHVSGVLCTSRARFKLHNVCSPRRDPSTVAHLGQL